MVPVQLIVPSLTVTLPVGVPEPGELTAIDLVPLLRRAVDAAEGPDRPLFRGNQAVGPRDDVVEELWQLTTTLREHRGDAHVAMLRSKGIDGLEAHVLAASVKRIPPPRLQESRGWSAEDWATAEAHLHERAIGGEAYEAIEAGTDELSAGPYDALPVGDMAMMLAMAERITDAITASDLIPFPNPIGLPRRHSV